MDAGDWIAVIAAAISTLSFAAGWRASSAAKRSATAAENTLPIAQRSADAAVDSANAAQRSANTAEAQRHREDAPVWHIEHGRKSGNKLPMTAQFVSGPNQISVGGFYHGMMFTARSSSSQEGTIFHDIIDKHEPLHRNETVNFTVELIDGAQEAEITVALQAEETGNPHGEQRDPWWHIETVTWKPRQVIAYRL